MDSGGRQLLRNGVSYTGAVLTTVSALLFLIVFLLDLFGFHTNPYLGILFFLALPSLFVLGLLMIPAGVLLARRRERAGKPARLGWPRIDFNEPRHRRIAALVLVLTLVNVTIVSLAAFKGIEFMDTPAFCGQVCHEVMEPEFVAYTGRTRAWHALNVTSVPSAQGGSCGRS